MNGFPICTGTHMLFLKNGYKINSTVLEYVKKFIPKSAWHILSILNRWIIKTYNHYTNKRWVSYQIKEIDWEIDEITTQSFQNYDEAYDMLANINEDLYCSDADYNDRAYYEIIEIKKWLFEYLLTIDNK